MSSAAVRQFLCKRTPAAWQKRREPSAVTKPRAQRIVDAYFSREHLDDRDGCCPLIGMASDVTELAPDRFRDFWR
jgi:TetR/AcrR family transcriptional regulator, transcriptional repressor for nem operon